MLLQNKISSIAFTNGKKNEWNSVWQGEVKVKKL